VSSIDGMTTKSSLVAYSGSKWALRGMTRVAAVELGKYGVRVNVVCPEAGSSAMFGPYVPSGIDPEVAASFSQRILKTQMKRSLGEKMDDVARMIVFLARTRGSCTGADFLSTVGTGRDAHELASAGGARSGAERRSVRWGAAVSAVAKRSTR
jgi:3alpha(or 20beta)-hydroxysteroid dehydrogenase